MARQTGMARQIQGTRWGIGKRIAFRLYLNTMGLEGMWALGARRWLIDYMTSQRHTDLSVFAHVFLEGIQGLRIGNHVSLNRGCNLSAAGGLEIGDYVSIGH